jgi:RNA polymerase sigma-70 factor (ECF subfamily)
VLRQYGSMRPDSRRIAAGDTALIEVKRWSEMSDEDLVESYRSCETGDGREQAINELFARYQVRITRWCIRFTRDHESALDLAQDIFLRVYRNLHTYRGDSRFSTWIYVIVRNQCMTALERRACQPAYVDATAATELPDASSTRVYSIIEEQDASVRMCRNMLGALTATEANVMMMHYGEDVALADITRSLGLKNKSGAKAYIVSARRKLSSLGFVSRAHAC